MIENDVLYYNAKKMYHFYEISDKKVEKNHVNKMTIL